MDNETTGNPFFLTLGAAAKQAGLSKATISRAIKDGKLSAVRNAETNSFKIDPAELQRYAEAVAVVRNSVTNAAAEQPSTGVTAVAGGPATLALIEERAARQLAEARLADLKAMLEELRGDRDQWREQAQRLALPAAREPGRRRWWWRRPG